MISLEQTILAAVQARLDGDPLGPIPKPEGFKSERYRLREIRPETVPFAGIYPVSADPSSTGSAIQEALEVKLALFAKTIPDQTVDQALDPVWLWITQQLLTDPSLGGISQRIQPGLRLWSANLAQRPFGDLDCHFLIFYRHQAADPTRP